MYKGANRKIGLMLFVSAAVAAASSSLQSAPLVLGPEQACTALAGVGLQGRGGYTARRGGTFRCDSRRKTIVAGDAAQDEIRFSALGDEQAVGELRLVLTVRSRGDVQRAHRKLAEYAGKLTEGTLQMPLPEDVNDAILSAVSGAWSNGGRAFELRRTTVADGLYELRLTIR